MSEPSTGEGISIDLLPSALAAFGDLFFAFDADGRLRDWNQALVEVTGYSEAELESMTPPDFFTGDDAERVREAAARVFDEGEATVEVTLSTGDGDEVPYEFRATRLTDESGTLLGFGGVGRDVTERRRRQAAIEERERVLRDIYDVTSDPDRSFEDQVGTLLEVGREVIGTAYGTLSRIRGDDYEFEVVSAPDDSVRAGDTVPLAATNCERTAARRETIVLSDVAQGAPELTDKTGYTEWGIACYLGAPVIVEGDVYGTFCFYDDEPREEPFSDWEITLVDLMSQWISYELTHQETHERLERQNEQLEEFASVVSHDLRNPLNVLQGSLELAAESGDREHFERCERAIGRMGDLVEDLLALARMGEWVTDPEPVELTAAARESWGYVATDDATLTVRTDRTVFADPDRLAQLFENLFRNSVEHSSTGSRSEAGDSVEHGGGSVTVTVGDADDGFYVSDDGPGIPEEDRERVFESGYSTAEQGTGFGLNIVRRAADAHGWDVRVVESEAGGARFEFSGVETA